MDDKSTQGKSSILDGFARALNASGSAILNMYDTTADLVSKAANSVVNITPRMPALPKFPDNMFSSLRLTKPGEKKSLDAKIKDYEGKVKKLYAEVGRLSAEGEDAESESIGAIVRQVKDYEREIERLKTRQAELKELENQEEAQRHQSKSATSSLNKKGKPDESKVAASVEAAIQRAIRSKEFLTDSEREIFAKIAGDILDSEMEIKIMAVSELGRFGFKAAVPILIEAAGYKNPYLISDIINALINLDDTSAIPFLKEAARFSNFRVRVGALRGLYKLAGDDNAIPVLLNALKDEHQEVRKTAATFLGWRDSSDTVPALVQALHDRDEGVKKSAITALSTIKDKSAVSPLIRTLTDESRDIREKALEAINTITGEYVSFNVDLTGDVLASEIDKLRRWWQGVKTLELSPLVAESVSNGASVKAAEQSETSGEGM
ncbi:MAG: HEAT repeat domain-containing protein [Nitrospirae bacterium]|nr:HEAT repeat domain-containing protein [Nitrospirota bacterium]MBF0534383.1 HEAT repeat domain-containing protein [Nitrospirota bacterium]MBF0615636.1 HEAT repeat domain-containing protein [Nitrospirota bacterium]